MILGCCREPPSGHSKKPGKRRTFVEAGVVAIGSMVTLVPDWKIKKMYESTLVGGRPNEIGRERTAITVVVMSRNVLKLTSCASSEE